MPTRDEIEAHLGDVLRRYPGVPQQVARSLFGLESGWNQNARSAKGAIGLGQLMPATARALGVDPTNWRQNVEGSMRLLDEELRHFGGDMPKALAAYHAGRGAVEKAGGIPGTHDGNLSTTEYVRRILGEAPQRERTLPARGDWQSPRGEGWQSTPGWAAEMGGPRTLPPPATAKKPGLWEDTKNLLWGGTVGIAQDFRELLRTVLGDTVVGKIDDLDKAITGSTLDERQAEAMSALSPETAEALRKEWWDDEKGTFGPALTDPRSWYGGLMQSLPGTVAVMLPAFRIARAVEKAALAKAAASGVGGDVARAAAAKAGSRAALIAGSVLEGTQGGAQASREVRDRILAAPDEVLDQSEAFRALLDEHGGDRTAARRELANDRAGLALVGAGVVTGIFGGRGDQLLYRFLRDGPNGPIWSRIGKGIVSEGVLEEFPQSYGSRVASNVALGAADPSVTPTQGALSEGIGGLALGGMMGAGMGAAFGRRLPPREATPPAAPPAVTPGPPVTPGVPPAPALPEDAEARLHRAGRDDVEAMRDHARPPAAAVDEIPDAEVARRMAAVPELGPGDVGRPADGLPFKARIAAEGARKRMGLTDTHRVVRLGPEGWVIRKIDEGAQGLETPPLAQTQEPADAVPVQGPAAVGVRDETAVGEGLGGQDAPPPAGALEPAAQAPQPAEAPVAQPEAPVTPEKDAISPPEPPTPPVEPGSTPAAVPPLPVADNTPATAAPAPQEAERPPVERVGWTHEPYPKRHERGPQRIYKHEGGIYQVHEYPSGTAELMTRRMGKDGRRSWEAARNQPNDQTLEAVLAEAERRTAYHAAEKAKREGKSIEPAPPETISPAAEPAAEPERSFASTQIALPGGIGQDVQRAAKRLIKPEDIHPTEGLEKRPHVTVKYGLHEANVEAVRKVLEGEPPIEGKITSIEIFQRDDKDYDVVVARVESDDLVRLNAKIKKAVPNTDTFPDYKPHVTLGYVKKGAGAKYANAKLPIEGRSFKVDTLELSDTDENITPIRLTGTRAPEAARQGASTGDTAAIAEAFDDAHERAEGDGGPVHHLFDPPAKGDVVRLQDKVKVHHAKHGWMTPAQAKAKIQEWKAHAAAQGKTRANADKVVLSLFDLTGQWSQPWEDAGYNVFRFDIQNDPEGGDVTKFSTEFFNDWWGDFDGQDIYAILAACPCTDFAVSGARHFAAKDKDGRTRSSVELVQQTLATIEHFKPSVWAIENPVGRIEKLAGLPPWRLSFDPNHFGDPYTKKTLLWGRFNADLPIAPVEPVEGSKMWAQYGGKSQATKNARSITPEGFAYSFFMANNAIDHPVMALANKYDRLDPKAIKAAVARGLSYEQVGDLIDDAYYIDLNDAEAERLLRGAKPAEKPAAETPAEPAAPEPPKPPRKKKEREPEERARILLIRGLKRLGGIKTTEARDITGEGAVKANRLLPGLFRNAGHLMDRVAEWMHENGYMTDAEYEDVDGGMQRARDIVRDLLDKRPIVRIGDMDEAARLEFASQLEDAYPEADLTPAEILDLLDSNQDATTAEAEAAFDINAALDAAGIMDEGARDSIRERAAVAADNGVDYEAAAKAAIQRHREARPADGREAQGQEAGGQNRPAAEAAQGVTASGAPRNRAAYRSVEEYEQAIRAPYADGASSRTTPAAAVPLAEGEWLIDGFKGLDGHDIEEVRRVPVDQVAISEDTGPEKWADVERYAGWLREGREPPPIRVIQHEDGYLKAQDHRRLLAHKLAGRDTILARVSWTTKSRRADYDGPTGLTYELAAAGAMPLPTISPPAGSTIFPDDAKRLERSRREQEQPALTSYTNEEVLKREADAKNSADARAKADAEAEARAKADAERDTFTLTGSNRPADVLAAQGQGGLFDAAPSPEDQRKAEFKALVARQKAERDELEQALVAMVERHGIAIADRKDGKHRIMLSENTREGGEKYRVTSFEIPAEGEPVPIGHREYKTIAEAASEFAPKDMLLLASPRAADPPARVAVEQQPAEAAAAIAKHGLPDGTVFMHGFGLAKNTWAASADGVTSNYTNKTVDEAAAELRRFLDAKRSAREYETKRDAAMQSAADKIKRGEQPAPAEWKFVVPTYRESHTYARQPEISDFLTQYLGVPKHNIRDNIGEAAGTLTSDSGAKYPIVYYAKLAKVFGPKADAKPADAKAPDKSTDLLGAATANVDDVGENLKYNRRNFEHGGLSWDDIKNENAAFKRREVQKPKVWPKPDYEALVADGMNPLVARMLKQVYDAIANAPAKADDDNLQGYIAAVQKVRDAMSAWTTDSKALSDFAAKAKDLAERRKGNPFYHVPGLSSTFIDRIWPVDTEAEQRTRHYRFRDEPARSEIIWLGGNRALQKLQPDADDLLKAVQDIMEGWPAKQEAWQKRFDVREDKGRWSLFKKGSRWARLRDQPQEGFASQEEAIAHARDVTKRAPGEGGDIRGTNVAQSTRTGPERRPAGVNVSSDDLMSTFGFRGVNFGRKGWIGDAERQAYLNAAYDGLHDLAELLGVPPTALSLNGMLGIAFGAQGRGGQAAAHFVPGVNEINLTKTMGAGTLAHEWGHALDHYFARLAGLEADAEPFLSAHARLAPTKQRYSPEKKGTVTLPRFGETLRPEMLAAFKAVADAMHKRPQSEGEAAQQLAQSKAQAARSVDRWLDAIKANMGVKGKPEEAEFDAIAERIRNGDLGEGVVSVGKIPLPRAVGELRALSKRVRGRYEVADNMKGLANAAEHHRYLLAKGEADAEHVPQLTSTAFYRESSAKDKDKKGKPYWATAWEMFARSFELFVADKLTTQGQSNTFLSDAQIRLETKDRSGGLAFPYPRGIDREAIGKAMQSLVDAIEHRPSDGGKIELYSPEKGYAASSPLWRSALSESMAKAPFAKDRVEGAAVSPVLHDDEAKRVAITARLKRIAKQLEEGREGLARADLRRLIEDREAANERVAARRGQDRVRGVDRAREILLRARRRGELSEQQVGLALWLLEQNPGLANDLAMRVTGKGRPGVAGNYNAYLRLVTLIEGRGDDTTAAHEILHHAERMMPEEVQEGIRDAWARDLADFESWAQGVDSVAARRAVALVLRMNAGDAEAQDSLLSMFVGGVLPERFYALTNPSEYWAENASRILSGRHAASKEGWVARAKQWLSEFIEKIKDLFGLPSGAAVLRGLEAVLRGDGSFVSRDLLHEDAAGRGLKASRKNVVAALDRGVELNALDRQITAQVVTDVGHRFANRLRDFRGLALQTLGRRQIADIYGDDIPELRTYSTLAQQMDADKTEAGAAADMLVRRWAKLRDERALADLMHEATLEGIDPDKPFVEGDDFSVYEHLRARWEALSPEAQAVYREARDSYEAHYSAVQQAIRDKIMRIMPASQRRAELLEQLDANLFQRIRGVYFPLQRFGDYLVVVKDSGGNTVGVNFAERLNEAESLQRTLRQRYPAADGYRVGKIQKRAEFNAGRDAVGRGFLQQLYGVFEQHQVGDDLIDAVNQLYLVSLPDLSWAKHGIHRKGTPGFSQNARRAYADNIFHGARYLAKLRYADQLESELRAIDDRIKAERDNEAFDGVAAQQVADEMRKRHDEFMSPKTTQLSTALTSVGFVWYLGLSPASAVVNLSQTALVAYPLLASKYGATRAARMLLAASRQTVAAKNDLQSVLRGDELAAINEAIRSGVIDVTLAHDLAGIAAGEDTRAHWKLRPIMRAASLLFHQAEKFNRQATFIAAYRMARATGLGHDAAYASAVEDTYESHFDYSGGNRPRVMQGNVARVILLFKQYAQNMIYVMARNAYLAVKGDRRAAKALAGVLTSHALGAGLLGLPVVGPLLAMASIIGGDDDDPWDAEVALRNALADVLGQKPAEVLMRGLSRAGPWDISARVGLDRLLLPDVREGLEGARLAQEFATGALGPVAGIGVNALKGLEHISEGRFVRGVETMVPTVLRSLMRSYRFMSEGDRDKTGIAIVEDTTPAEEIGQLLGFRPSRVAEQQEAKSAVYNADRRLNERRQALLTALAMATRARDPEGVAEARAAIRRFNERNPSRRITADTIAKSLRMRERRLREAENGIYLQRNRGDVRELGRFAAD